MNLKTRFKDSKIKCQDLKISTKLNSATSKKKLIIRRKTSSLKSNSSRRNTTSVTTNITTSNNKQAKIEYLSLKRSKLLTSK